MTPPSGQRLSGPVIDGRQGTRCVQIVGQGFAQGSDDGAGVRSGGQSRGGAPAP